MRNKFYLINILLLCICSSLQADTLRIYFPPDRAFLENTIERQIAKALPSIDRQQKIVLIGYADDRGDVYYNDMLSMRRAQTVAKYLVSNGFSNASIKQCIGKGEISRWHYEKSKGNTDRRVDIIFSRAKPDLAKKVVRKEKSLPDVPALKFKHILFPNGIAVPEPGALSYLDTVHSVLVRNKALKIEITGHLCCPVEQVLDSSQNNIKLSENRAKMVYRYLVDKGIEPGRMGYKGFGGLHKIHNEPGGLNHGLNRRVEIRAIRN